MWEAAGRGALLLARVKGGDFGHRQHAIVDANVVQLARQEGAVFAATDVERLAVRHRARHLSGRVDQSSVEVRTQESGLGVPNANQMNPLIERRLGGEQG